MTQAEKVVGATEAWESGSLGRDVTHAKHAPKELEKEVDDILGMQAISIRLEKDLIKSFKMIAQYHDVGYQPLMRDALKRFAEAEFKQIATKAMNEKKVSEASAEATPKPSTHKKAA